MNITTVKTPHNKNLLNLSRLSYSTRVDTSPNNNNYPSTAKNMFRGRKLENPLKYGEPCSDYEYSNFIGKGVQTNRSPFKMSLQTPISFNTRFDEKIKL